MTILETVDLKKYYRQGDHVTKALDGVDLTINEGEFAAVVGTSGSGKSTLLHMMGGLDTPTSGRVLIGGKEIFYPASDEARTSRKGVHRGMHFRDTVSDDTRLSRRGLHRGMRFGKNNEEKLAAFRRRHIGFIFQNYNLIPVLNVYENMVLPLQLDGRKADRKLMEQIIYALGLQDKLQNPANNLSGGQQQRVAIARALLTKPEIILADEPTGNLDSRTSADVLSLLKDSGRQFHQTIVMITHDRAIAKLADRIIRIEDGKITDQGGERHVR